MKRIGSTIVSLLCFAISSMAQVSFGDAKLFNNDWLFCLEEIEDACFPEYDDAGWARKSLPHDWSVEQHLSPDNASCMGYLPGGTGWYRKHFKGEQFSSDKLYVYFEGVYNRSEVYVNGHLVGKRPSGYASFMYDISPFINKSGDNLIAVKVDHSQDTDSRFYTGSGIYRNVWMIEAGTTHFSQWGVGYSADVITDRYAIVDVDTSIDGLDGNRYTLQIEFKDAEDRLVAKKRIRACDRQVTPIRIDSPHLWDLADPYLYSMNVSIMDGKTIIDRTSTRVGIRRLEFNPDKGFALNGRWMKVKGVCIHHDAGVLGSAVPDDVLERRLIQLRKIGTNAIRTSHNPQSPSFYDLCDRLGFLVMDEAFDEWEFAKKKWIKGWNKGEPRYEGTYDFFNEWGERDLTDMVRRDRNHPCIFLWSIGNEVDYPNDPYSHPVLDGNNLEFTQPMYGGYKPDAPDAMRIGEIAERLAACVRAVDRSRPVTGALAGVVMSNQTSYPEAVDVVGYNYTESRYGTDHENYPERIIYGSENRKDYEAWKDVRDNEHIFGQFIWTGIDYLGESLAWPSRGFGSGLLDFCGFIKPSGHARAAMWCDEPVCYIGTGNNSLETWNYEEGEEIQVNCYTNAAMARLTLDGEQFGDVRLYDDDKGFMSWTVPFKPGTIKAEAMDKDGNVVAEHSIKTSQRPYALRLTADKTELAAQNSVAQIIVEVVDEYGNPVNLADNEITCTIEGPASLLGLESGNHTDMTDYTLSVRRVYRGRMLAYVQRTAASGNMTVKFTSPLLKGAEIKLKAL